MSYYKLKNLSISEKKNKIMVTAACNNISPLLFETVEYAENIPEFNEKLKALFKDIWCGEIKPYPSCMNGVIHSALKNISINLSNKHGICIGNTWDMTEENREKIIEEMYPLFKRIILERKKG